MIDIALGGADAMIPTMNSELPTRPCKHGHTGSWVINAQGRPICTSCKNAKAKARYDVSRQRVPIAVAVPTAIARANSTAKPGTFLAVAEEYLRGQDAYAVKTVDKMQFLLAQLHAIHNTPIADLTTPEIVRALKAIEAYRDRRETARRAGGLVGAVTRFAVNHGYAKTNALPEGQLRGTLKPLKVESHAAITDPKIFGLLLDKISLYTDLIGSKNHPSVSVALALAPHVFLRPGELRQLEWSEVNFERAEILIDGSKMKMRRPHLVPLSTQAMEILREQHKESGTGRYVFPAKVRRNQTNERPLSENAFREAFKTIMPLMQDQREEQSMHGFRASASTMLNEQLGFDSALVELQLAHARKDKVAGIYDRSQRVQDRKAMMQAWSDYIIGLRGAARKKG